MEILIEIVRIIDCILIGVLLRIVWEERRK